MAVLALRLCSTCWIWLLLLRQDLLNLCWAVAQATGCKLEGIDAKHHLAQHLCSHTDMMRSIHAAPLHAGGHARVALPMDRPSPMVLYTTDRMAATTLSHLQAASSQHHSLQSLPASQPCNMPAIEQATIKQVHGPPCIVSVQRCQREAHQISSLQQSKQVSTRRMTYSSVKEADRQLTGWGSG